MSERLQHTAARMRTKMLTNYGEEIHHKHNKNHLHNPPHKKIQVILTLNNINDHPDKWSAKTIQDFKGRKTRKRLDKGDFH
jgi:hypothetical protein